jgi:segregation and condensation protein B
MEEERLKAILESLLFAAGEPVPVARLATVLENVPQKEIRNALAQMSAAYASGIRGIVLEEVAGGFQLRTAKEHAFYVRKLLATRPPRLSRPLLETLAIVAYRQPITRPEIEQLRGVDTGGVLDTLLERRLIKIAGRKEAPGRPLVYATTPEFLETFGLKDLEQLPDLGELREIDAAIGESSAAGDTRPIQLELGPESPQASGEAALAENEAAPDQSEGPDEPRS